MEQQVQHQAQQGAAYEENMAEGQFAEEEDVGPLKIESLQVSVATFSLFETLHLYEHV